MILELTTRDRIKVAVKRFLSLSFSLVGGFYFMRLFSKPSITILTYHRIIEGNHGEISSYISVKKSDFQRQVDFYKKHYSVISLDEAIDRLKRNIIVDNYLVITFDDGYKDNYSLGLEIFESEGIMPTIFVTTGCVDKQESLWPDKVRNLLYNAILVKPVKLPEISVEITPEHSGRISAVKSAISHIKKMDVDARDKYLSELKKIVGDFCRQDRLMLNWDEVKDFSDRGISIGAHTINHPVLANISEKESENEIAGSKAILETKLGKPVTLFAYPNGTVADFTGATISQLKSAGYKAAVTTIRGVNRVGVDLFRLRRTGVYLTDTLSDIKLKLALEAILSK